MKKTAAPERAAVLFLILIDADLFFVLSQALVFYHAVFESEERIVSADADVVTGVDLRAPLTDENASRKNGLPVLTFYAEALCITVSSVVRGTRSLFMSE